MTEISAYEKEKQEVLAAQQDPNAFGVLYERYFEKIFRFVLRKCQDTDTANDITQQTFINALHALPKYQFKGHPFSSWLYRIASNEVYQHTKNLKKKITFYADYKDVQNFQNSPTTFEIDLQDIAEKHLKSWLEELKPEYFRIIELRFFDQLSFNEIAIIENIGLSAAKMKTYRALKKLKRIINSTKKEDFPDGLI